MKTDFNYYAFMSLDSISRYYENSLENFFNNKLLNVVDNELSNIIFSIIEPSLGACTINRLFKNDFFTGFDGDFDVRDYCFCSLLSPFLSSITDESKVPKIFCCNEIVRRYNFFYYTYSFKHSPKLLVFGGRIVDSKSEHLIVSFGYVIDFVLNEFTFLYPFEVTRLIPLLIYSDFYNLSLCDFYVKRAGSNIEKSVSSFINKNSGFKQVKRFSEDFYFSISELPDAETFFSLLHRFGLGGVQGIEQWKKR